MPFASALKPSPVLEHSGEGLSYKTSKPSVLKTFLQWLPAADALLVPDYSALTSFFF